MVDYAFMALIAAVDEILDMARACVFVSSAVGQISMQRSKVNSLPSCISFSCKSSSSVDLPYVPVWPGQSRFKRLSRCPVPVSKMSRNFTSAKFSK